MLQCNKSCFGTFSPQPTLTLTLFTPHSSSDLLDFFMTLYRLMVVELKGLIITCKVAVYEH